MAELAHITAVILAGGFGTRLREAVSDRPKVLAQVNGRPFIFYLLDRLVAVGIKQAVLCTGFMAELVNTTLGDSYHGMTLLYSREDLPLGTAGSLRQALPLITSDPVLVMNGDSFCDADLELFARRHLSTAAMVSLLLANVEEVARYGAVEVDGSGNVVSFREKGNQGGAGVINAGIYLLAKQAIESIPPGKMYSLEQQLFPSLIGEGLAGFFQKSLFIDIGIPADYLSASCILKPFVCPASTGEES